MSQFWSSVVQGLTPYVPGEQPKMTKLVKLNTNENPYPPSPKAVAAMQAELGEQGERLRLYPDPNAELLKHSLANYYGLSSRHVFVGNGSDEVLAHAFCAFFQQGKPLLFPDISYSFYPVYCGLYGIEPRPVPLAEDFSIQVADYAQDCAGVIFPNPNAPTGMLLPIEQVEALLKQHPKQVVLVDEAYIDFGGQSAASLVNSYPNLLVVQTLSKSRSLAGLRVGLALGHPDLIEGLERVKNSFNSYPLDRLAIVGAAAAIEDQAYFQQTCQRVIDSREQLVLGLTQLGFRVLPSKANFVFACHAKSAAELSAKLREQGIIVRHFKQPRIDNFLRITVGTDEQNQQLLRALAPLLG